MGFLKQLHRLLIPLENTIVMLLVFLEMILMFLQVVARLWGGGWLFIEELSRYLVLWIGVFGALIATRARRHIALEILPRVLPEPLRRVLYFAQDLFVATIAFILVWSTWRYMEVLKGETSPAIGIGVWWLLLPFLTGLALVGLRFLLAALGAYEEEPQLLHTEEGQEP